MSKSKSWKITKRTTLWPIEKSTKLRNAISVSRANYNHVAPPYTKSKTLESFSPKNLQLASSPLPQLSHIRIRMCALALKLDISNHPHCRTVLVLAVETEKVEFRSITNRIWVAAVEVVVVVVLRLDEASSGTHMVAVSNIKHIKILLSVSSSLNILRIECVVWVSMWPGLMKQIRNHVENGQVVQCKNKHQNLMKYIFLGVVCHSSVILLAARRGVDMTINNMWAYKKKLGTKLQQLSKQHSSNWKDIKHQYNELQHR